MVRCDTYYPCHNKRLDPIEALALHRRVPIQRPPTLAIQREASRRLRLLLDNPFAAQVLAVLKALKDPAYAKKAGLDEALGAIPESILNPRGGSIALGHPVGATAARLVLSSLHQLKANQGHRALVSLCIGGGQGAALWLERT